MTVILSLFQLFRACFVTVLRNVITMLFLFRNCFPSIPAIPELWPMPMLFCFRLSCRQCFRFGSEVITPPHHHKNSAFSRLGDYAGLCNYAYMLSIFLKSRLTRRKISVYYLRLKTRYHFSTLIYSTDYDTH